MVLEVLEVLAKVTDVVFLPTLPRAIVKAVQAPILPNSHQARVMHTVALGQILVTLHQTTVGDSNDLNLKAWVQDLEDLEWVLIVVRAEHQITADNPLARTPHETNQ